MSNRTVTLTPILFYFFCFCDSSNYKTQKWWERNRDGKIVWFKVNVSGFFIHGLNRANTFSYFSSFPLPSSGHVSLDFPLPRLPSGTVARRLALPRAPQVHQLLRQGVWLHAAAVHAVPCGLCAFQNAPATRQDQMLQVHLAAGRSENDDEVERVNKCSAKYCCES